MTDHCTEWLGVAPLRSLIAKTTVDKYSLGFVFIRSLVQANKEKQFYGTSDSGNLSEMCIRPPSTIFYTAASGS